jgi:Arc/MetJ-type ribon-helix-helix transcriptional regulator
MLTTEDDVRIVRLKRRLKAKSKADIVRAGLRLLEQQAEREDRSERLRRAAIIVGPNSRQWRREIFGEP